MKRVAYNLNQYDMVYVPYSDFEQRILSFPGTVEANIGKDDSGQYDIHGISLGDPGKPAIMMQGAIHGDEWHTAHFVMQFMELLASNTFPDRLFRSKLLAEYHLYAIPCLNPWGYENNTRLNANGVNCNRDYGFWQSSETRTSRDKHRELKPLAFLDMHMYPLEHLSGPPSTIMIAEGGNRQAINRKMAYSFHLATGEDYTLWGRSSDEGHSRNWSAEQESRFAPYTLSVLTEIAMSKANPGTVLPFKTKMWYGLLQIYFFLLYAIDYHRRGLNV